MKSDYRIMPVRRNSVFLSNPSTFKIAANFIKGSFLFLILLISVNGHTQCSIGCPTNMGNEIGNGDFEGGHSTMHHPSYLQWMVPNCFCGVRTICFGNYPSDKCSNQPEWNQPFGDHTMPGGNPGTYLIIDGRALKSDHNTVWSANKTVFHPGGRYIFSYWLRPDLTLTGIPVQLQLYIDGAPVGGIHTGTGGDWIQFCEEWIASDPPSGKVLLELKELTYGEYGHDFGIDDMFYGYCPVIEGPCIANADFDFSFDENCKVRFTDKTNLGPSTEILSHHWDFADGSFSNEQSPVHRFSNGGTYTVKLTIEAFNPTTNECCTSTLEEDVVITCTNSACTLDVDYQALETSPCVYHFTANNVNSNRDIKMWQWDFGDGTTAVGKNVTKTFVSGGRYKVMLRGIAFFDQGCCSDFILREINVDCSNSGKTRSQATEIGNAKLVGSTLTLFPNPGKEETTIRFNLAKDDDVSLVLFDVHGKKVKQIAADFLKQGMQEYTINLSEIEAGMYFCLLVSGNQFESQKLIIQK